MADERDRDRDLVLVLMAVLAGGWWDEEPPFPPMRHLIERLARNVDDPLRRDVMMLVERMVHRPPIHGRMRSIAEDVVRGLATSVDTRIARLHEAVEAVQEEHKGTTSELHSLLWLASTGVDIAKVPLSRYVPLRIYVGESSLDRERLERLKSSAERFVNEFGFEKADDLGEERGSWWSRQLLRIKRLFRSDEVQDVLKDACDAINGASHLPQAEANKKHAEATKELVASLANFRDACLQIGSLLIVKRTDEKGNAVLVAKTLSVDEVKRIETNQQMLGRPAEVLDWLGSGSASPPTISTAANGHGTKSIPGATSPQEGQGAAKKKTRGGGKVRSGKKGR